MVYNFISILLSKDKLSNLLIFHNSFFKQKERLENFANLELSKSEFFILMTMQLNVPSIVCEGCAETITKAIESLDAEAEVKVNLEAKIVTIDSKSSLESIKQAIAARGHTVE